jgi:peptidylprolyl isomerase
LIGILIFNPFTSDGDTEIAGNDEASSVNSVMDGEENYEKPEINIDEIGLDRLEESPGELVIDTLEEGDGATVSEGDNVSVHYLGVLADGTEFDNSYDRGAPFSFVVGAGMVIDGWDQGLVGAEVGEKRLLLIPSELGYGERGAGASIPPDSDLVFHVEVVDIN